MLGTAEGILLFDIKKECFLNDTCLPAFVETNRFSTPGANTFI